MESLRWHHGHFASSASDRHFIRTRIDAEPLNGPAKELGLEQHPSSARELPKWRGFAAVVAQR
ncbi:MAG: hypothetical protein IT453_07145 [Planctomycetes bacterium]|nr:hypothetical protein [Planctomycetota bacterium]